MYTFSQGANFAIFGRRKKDKKKPTTSPKFVDRVWKFGCDTFSGNLSEDSRCFLWRLIGAIFLDVHQKKLIIRNEVGFDSPSVPLSEPLPTPSHHQQAVFQKQVTFRYFLPPHRP